MTAGRLRPRLVAAVLASATLVACTEGAPTKRVVEGWERGAARTVAEPEGCDAAGTADLGVFRETAPQEVRAFERWLGCPVDVVVDYSARDSWEDIANPAYLLESWRSSKRRLVLGVAMLPQADSSATIQLGAEGAYDDYFRELGETLVAAGRGRSVLRIGWEFNLNGSRWFTDDAESFKTYWRRIAEAISVPGSDFVLDWNPNKGVGSIDAVDYYPGDDVVDVVGLDAYDVAAHVYPYPEDCDADCVAEVQETAWDDHVYGGARGLEFWSDFAQERDKPMSLPEWGLWERPDGTGGGENLHYLQKMHEFITDPHNAVLYHAYFEFDGYDGQHRIMTTFDEAGSLFRELFAGR
ncbi:glycosyl hydrolase [Nocardioides sp. Arc9.136]|uniref:glycosyl hydrolase n=1 Tax=Nocardioides sp. Arc9.136 TaxID=2996826 RepID=UPI00266717AD|nr:glycosyl hydrolase [Nocardioides sp. Arc9.136]WKN48581.1 glycosyl hydrolase [Nocardioides sp. Arc9.136]